MVHARRTSCRVCGDGRLDVFLELGPQPLANAFPASPAEFARERFFPLGVALCAGCALVQTPDVIDPEVLFGEYLYVSGTSETMAAHFGRYAEDVTRELALEPGELVVEAASNDGTLLARFAERGARVLGIEPARNVAARARERGVETVAAFLDEPLAARIAGERGPARAVVANNVLAHVDDTPGFLRALRTLAGERGRVVVEVPWLGHLVERLEYDTIYHEHLAYFSVTALARAFGDAGLGILRVDDVPVHGGSLRVHAEPGRSHAAAVLERAAAERAAGLTDPARFRRFAADVERARDELVELLRRLRARGATVAAYGAPAKGGTLLNYCAIGPELVAYTVDKSPLKVGRFMPGTHLPILPAEELLQRRPDYCLVLAWNMLEEIMEQQRAWRAGGGRFIVPVPRPEIVA